MSILSDGYWSGSVNLTADQITQVNSAWLDNYEEKILKKLMGQELYKAYITDLNGTSDPTAQRFKDLVDGAEFSFDYYGSTVNLEWNGLRDADLQVSLIANYVYFNFRNQTETINTNVGQKTASAELAVQADVFPKLRSVWNDMIDMYGETPEDYIKNEYFLDLSGYAHFNTLASAYNFLLANEETYPEWVFTPLRRINIMWI